MTTATAGREVTYLEAISQALDEEMTRDERVFLMGEDIGPYGGAFRVTGGFQQKDGEGGGVGTAPSTGPGRGGRASRGTYGGGPWVPGRRHRPYLSPPCLATSGAGYES